MRNMQSVNYSPSSRFLLLCSRGSILLHIPALPWSLAFFSAAFRPAVGLVMAFLLAVEALDVALVFVFVGLPAGVSCASCQCIILGLDSFGLIPNFAAFGFIDDESFKNVCCDGALEYFYPGGYELNGTVIGAWE